MTYNEVAMTQALIGDIKALQEALGYEVKPADLTIRLAKKLRAKLVGEVLQRMPPDLAASVSEAMDLTVKQAVQQFVKPTEEVTKTTYEIFRDAMKNVSEASEKAYLAGARDTVKQHKNLAKIAKERLEKAQVTQGEMNRLLSAVSRARTEKEQVHAMAAVQAIADKARKRHAAKRIKKPTPMSVDFFYREAIENIKAGIDPSFRTEKTLTRRRRTEEFFKKHPEKVKDIPAKVRNTLTKKSLGEMTIEELEQVAQAIETLEQQGKLKRKLTLAQKERKFSEKKDVMVGAITKGEPIESESRPKVFSTTKEGLVKTAAIKTRAWTLRPARIFDLLDRRKNFQGPNHKFFIDRTNELTDKKWRMTDARVNPGKAKQEDLGINAKTLSQTRTVNDVRYTVDEMIDIYAKSKNPASKLAMMYGNNLEESDIDAVINTLSETEKAWGDYIIEEYGENYDRLRNTVIEVENRDMGSEENYTPIRRTDIDYKTHTEEIVNSLLQRENLRKAYTAKGFTIQRKNIPAEFQKPIRLGITSMWLEQVAKQEHYINLAQHVRDMHRLRESPEFRNAVRTQFGNEYNKVIEGYVNRVANPNIYRSFDSLENVSRRLRQNAALAYLSYNLLTMAKQLPSAFLYLPDAGLTHWLSSATRFAQNPLATIQRVRELDPQVKHKAIERELEELKKAGGNIVAQLTKRFGRLGMQGIYMMDAVARTIGWDAVYQKALDDHMSEAEAIRAAQDATLRTQPAAAAKDLPQLYATSEFAHWFTMFTNQLNQIYNIGTYDIPSYVINKQYGNAALGALGLGVTALTIWMISHRDTPDEPEDFLEAATEQAINATPLIGKAIMAGKKGWGDSGVPAFEGGKAFGRALAAIERGDFTENDLKIVTEAIAVTFGVPYIGPKRGVTAVKEQRPSALLGGQQKKKRKGITSYP
jgi:DNA-binding phage protein